MKLREHRGSLNESMGTVIEIPATTACLKDAITATHQRIGVCDITDEKIHVTPYGFDQRTKWETYIVTVDGYGVFGFTDAPVPNAEITGSALLRSRARMPC